MDAISSSAIDWDDLGALIVPKSDFSEEELLEFCEEECVRFFNGAACGSITSSDGKPMSSTDTLRCFMQSAQIKLSTTGVRQ